MKDENGEIGFVPRVGPARASRSARRATTTTPRDVARRAHERGDLPDRARSSSFEDPVLSRARPGPRDPPDGRLGLARRGRARLDEPVRQARVEVQRRRRGRGRAGGLRRDHVRLRALPVRRRRRPRRLPEPAARSAKREAIPAFLRYAKRRLEPFDVRVSAAVFGLSAARDLGIGQLPRRMAPYLDTVYAMTYPSLFGAGELGLQDPSTAPGATVARALRRFELALRGRDVLVVPWVQDFSFTVPYEHRRGRRRSTPRGSPARRATCSGTPRALYTDGALAPPS